MRKLSSFTNFPFMRHHMSTCINCNGDILLHAWLNIADQKWSVTWTQCSLTFLTVQCAHAHSYNLYCVQWLPQGSSTSTKLSILSICLFLAGIYCFNPFKPDFTLSSSSTTSRELLSQFSTCSG